MINNIFRNITILKGLVISAVLIGTLLPASLSAQETALSAMVDKNDITLDDYVLLRLSVKGTRDEPQLPEVSEFRIQPRGSSSQVRIVNGQMSSTVEYNYLLYPKKTGSFTIGPFYLKGRGRRIESNTIRISIQKAAAADTASKDVFVRLFVLYYFQFCAPCLLSRKALS